MPFRLSKLFLYASLVAIVLVTPSTLFPFIVGKYTWFRLMVELAAVFFLWGIAFHDAASQKLTRLKALFRSPIVIAVTVFVAVFLLACLFGVDPANSFWSNFERGEGGFQMLHLYLFFLLAATLFERKKDWNRALIVFFVVAFFMIIYGVAAGLKYTDAKFVENGTMGPFELSGEGGPLFQTFQNFVGPPFNQPNYRFQGSVGNPAYVAAFLIFAAAFLLYYIFTNYQENLFNRKSVWWWALLIVFLVFFWLAATRGGLLGLVFGVISALIYAAYSKKEYRKWFIGIGIIIVGILFLMFLLRNTNFVQHLPGARLFDLSFYADTFSTRRVIWSMAWQGFLERPLLGYGPENFLVVFQRHFDTRYFNPPEAFGAWFDRAHSLFFDALAETGILGLLSFVGIFVAIYFCFWEWRRRNSTPLIAQRSIALRALLFALPLAYLVQGIILFDVLVIYIPLFLMFALLTYEFETSEEHIHNE